MMFEETTTYRGKVWPKSELDRNPGEGQIIRLNTTTEIVSWTPWRLIVRSSDRKGDWHESFPLTREERPQIHDKGVYQIAIGDEQHKYLTHPVVVYLGRARGETPTAAYSLRKRIQQYIRGQDRIAKSLKIFLDIGCVIYARWSYHAFEMVDIVEETLLSLHDYPLAKTNNPPVRNMEDILMRNLSTCELVKCYDHMLELVGADVDDDIEEEDIAEDNIHESNVDESSGITQPDADVLEIVRQFMRLSTEQQAKCRQYLDAFQDDEATS